MCYIEYLEGAVEILRRRRDIDFAKMHSAKIRIKDGIKGKVCKKISCKYGLGAGADGAGIRDVNAIMTDSTLDDTGKSLRYLNMNINLSALAAGGSGLNNNNGIATPSEPQGEGASERSGEGVDPGAGSGLAAATATGSGFDLEESGIPTLLRPHFLDDGYLDRLDKMGFRGCFLAVRGRLLSLVLPPMLVPCSKKGNGESSVST